MYLEDLIRSATNNFSYFRDMEIKDNSLNPYYDLVFRFDLLEYTKYGHVMVTDYGDKGRSYYISEPNIVFLFKRNSVPSEHVLEEYILWRTFMGVIHEDMLKSEDRIIQGMYNLHRYGVPYELPPRIYGPTTFWHRTPDYLKKENLEKENLEKEKSGPNLDKYGNEQALLLRLQQQRYDEKIRVKKVFEDLGFKEYVIDQSLTNEEKQIKKKMQIQRDAEKFQSVIQVAQSVRESVPKSFIGECHEEFLKEAQTLLDRINDKST